VIVDPDDDIATVAAVHALAAREPGVLAVSIAPGTREEPAVVWAILRALGKRIEQLERAVVKVWWMDAERWLRAHRITEVVVLCAQHLGKRARDELETEVGRRQGIALIFVYGGATRGAPAATTTLEAYLARQRRSLPLHGRSRPWPLVPRSHPLRFRYDCWKQLPPEEFARVELLLIGAVRTPGGWRWSMGIPSRREIARASHVVCAAEDCEQAYIRRCGAEIALINAQIAFPPTAALALPARTPTAEQIQAIHAYTSPAAAGYQLAKLITSLPDDLLGLIGGDQITDDAILGCPVPEPARAILRAIDDRHEPVLELSVWTPPEPIDDTISAEDRFASAVGWLLRGRSERIRIGELPPELRSRFKTLRANGILELSRGVYRASHTALYSSFRLAGTPRSGL
jgi:hypothetical protein